MLISAARQKGLRFPDDDDDDDDDDDEIAFFTVR